VTGLSTNSDHRAQQPPVTDLASRAEVTGQHRGENHAVDDHRFGEFGKHRVLLMSSVFDDELTIAFFAGLRIGARSGRRRQTARPVWYRVVPDRTGGFQPTG